MFHLSTSIHYAAYLQTNKAKAQSCWRIAGDVPSTSIRWILQKTCHVQLNPFDHAIRLGSRYTGWSATVLRSCAQSLWWCHWKNWCENRCESNQTNIFPVAFIVFLRLALSNPAWASWNLERIALHPWLSVWTGRHCKKDSQLSGKQT